MGIGDWGLGIGDWGLGPIPNPQSPIPIEISNKMFVLMKPFYIYIYKAKKFIVFINLKIVQPYIRPNHRRWWPIFRMF